ncbi:MAG: hypothetical protein IPH85_06405 [Ignavibacteria bacterium]|nr:hypothetical protein [Ignavibacteria bacterium]MBK7185552.1 hypothetical protein [Ignavibacteria bacterium]MBK9184253.1 hypothetical protein [Ignavibacteria bacterium]MBL0322155.1 hypothetical protein [Ignavibacteria bacterium]
MAPHEYMTWLWNDKTSASRNANGSTFEYAIASVLLSRHISPFYVQANILHVDGVSFDFVLFRAGLDPIVISAKTSLRERWKQAELEGRVLKSVYTKALCYLVTMDEGQADNIQSKVEKREAVGIDRVVRANKIGFSELISELTSHTYKEAVVQPPVLKSRIVSLIQ